MSAARFFTDEDVYAAVAPALRKAGLDAVSTPEAGRLGESDESQLTFTAVEARVLVTFNVAHFAALHAAWMTQGRHHAAPRGHRRFQPTPHRRLAAATAQPGRNA